MNTPFKYHEDSGHGWLEVSGEELAKVGLTPAAFSIHTYVALVEVDWPHPAAPTYFLEEDCDMPLFMLAYANRHGKRPDLDSIYHDGDCFIRQLGRNIAGPPNPPLAYAKTGGRA